MIGQTAEWLSADDILDSRLCKSRHFGRYEPALAHYYALIDVLVRKLSQVLEVVEGLEAALLLHYLDELLLLCIDKLIAYLVEYRLLCGMVVYLGVVECASCAVHYELQQRRHNGLAALGNKEILKMIVCKGRIFYIYLANYADSYLLFIA